MANCLPYSILISPSSAKSIFPDSFAGLNKHHKSSLFKFRGRAFSFRSDQRRHTLTRRLRHLAASKARSSRAPSPRFFGSPRGSAVAPQPLPLPDAAHTLPPSYSTVNTRLPLPKTEKAPTPTKCKREKREQSDALRRDANGNGDAGFARRPVSHDSRRNTEHADTLASRRSLRKPNGTKKYMLNVPISIPRNPFSSLSQSPHRSISDIFTTHYMSPPVFQASYASELPLSDMTPGLGFSYQKPYESIAFSVDNSSIHSSRVSFGHNAISPNRPVTPVSPLHNRLLTDNSMAPRESNGLNAINSCGPLSPWHITLSTVTSMAQRESNAQSKVHPHPLPLPPNAAILPSQPAPSPKVTDNLESIKSRWKKGKLIGRGTFGSVYVGSNRETGALCAMKEVELIPDDPKSSECIRQLEQEIKVLSQLKHTNIVQYYGSEIVGDRFYIYLEYVHPGSIVKYVHGHCGAITESVVQNFSRHILSGLAYLHSTKTIHRDIKGANLLVDAYGVVKLADFGMAKHICTIPLDTAKVRLQLQKKAVAGDGVALPKYRGMLGTVGTIAREEGLSALWKGIVPGLHRQCLFGGLRIGLYEPVKNLYVGENFVGDVPLSKKILAGLTTGALAITVANPTDLVKVRLQAEGKLAPGVPRRYSGALNAYSTIVRQEGVGALWTGLGPNVARNAIINAAELASYDQVKQTILKIPGFTDNIFTHLLSGLGAGFVAVCIGSPVDVVKSRMMGDPTYKSTLDCFVKTLKNDGPFAFYKGFIPNFGRLGSWNVIMFLTLEQAKKFVRSIESA